MNSTNGIADVLRAVTHAGAGASTSVIVSVAWVWNVGIPSSQLPVEWLFEASFLLAVVFVTGPRVAARDLAKGVAVIVAVQSATRLVPPLVPLVRL